MRTALRCRVPRTTSSPPQRLDDSSDVPEAKRGILLKNKHKLNEKDTPTFNSPSEEWVLPVPPIKEPEEREFAVDSGAHMHMVSEKDLNSGELETVRTSRRSPTTVMTANGEVRTRRSDSICQTIGLICQSYVP